MSSSLISGDTIYGRVMVDPVQNLGDSFFCSIEKVFLCTGADGYVPKYNPTKFEFGCLADSPSLLYRFKIIVSTFYNINMQRDAKSNFTINTNIISSLSCFTLFLLNLKHLTRTRLSQRLRHVCLVMSVLMLCWQWMIHQPCPSSDSQGLMALEWTLQPCSRYPSLGFHLS